MIKSPLPASLEEDYDLYPYPALCFAQTHPNRLAALATLLGLKPAPVEQCRVLELGCAVGGNIIPMAYALPHSEFVGVDFSHKQVEAGQATVDRLGLTNIRLEATDIRRVTPEWGQFDFIIAHGIYSWVPKDVRDAMLAICRHNLAPHGIAYISYNTLPGHRMLGAAREMMLYHTRNIADPMTRAREARELIGFLADSIPERTDAYGSFLDSYRKLMGKYGERTDERNDALLLHDELERVNEAVYFHEFAAHAAEYDLQYLAESEFSTVMPTNFKSDTLEWLQQTARDVVEMEQYMDFVRNRTFRQTLLCHKERNVDRKLRPDPGMMARFAVSSRAVPDEPDADMTGPDVVMFRAPDGAEVSTDHPVSKVAMMLLAKNTPRAIPFEELLAQARRLVYDDAQAPAPRTAAAEQDARILGANLLRSFTYSMRLIDLHTHVVPFVTSVSSKPTASPYARLQAARGETKVTNLLHERVSLDPGTLFLLPLADGAHDHQTMATRLAQFVEAQQDNAQLFKELTPGKQSYQEQVEEEVQRGLQWLGRAALLIA